MINVKEICIKRVILASLLTAVLFGVGCTSETELKWNVEEGYRWAKVEPGFWGSTGFEELSPSATGIEFTNRLSKEEIRSNQHYLNGSGVAAGDIDGDGLPDLYFTSLSGSNRLYKNMGGFEFKDVTESAGVAHRGHYSTGTAFSDIDGDGDMDLLVGSMESGVAIYENKDGKFVNRSILGEEKDKGNMTLALSDIDSDGDLDIYVTNYKEQTVKGVYGIRGTQPEDILSGYIADGDTSYRVRDKFKDDYKILKSDGVMRGVRETGEEDALYINEGDGEFRKADASKRFLRSSGPNGLPSDWGLHATFRDINDDGHPDLYVNNDFWTPDRIWINQGDGTFRDVDSHVVRNMSLSSMGADVSDVDRDGRVDIFVTDMLSMEHRRRLSQRTPRPFFPTRKIESRPQYNRNSLYLNRGDHTYAEISHFSGVAASEWSWATRFMDVDLDGYEDLIINTGFSYDYQHLDTQERIAREWAQSSTSDRSLTEYPSLNLENIAYRNDGDLTFSEKSSDWGISGEKDVSHGLATADFDNDGDLDLVISRLNDVSSVYENKSTDARIAVQLSADGPNTQGIGAKVTLSGGEGSGEPQHRQLNTGDYLSSSEPLVMFAADPENSDHTIRVEWSDGTESVVQDVGPNRVYEVFKKGSEGDEDKKDSDRKYIFQDVSERIGHEHKEMSFNDFRYQPLLPIKLSRLGPGVSWVDYNSDGYEDIFIASGKGGELAVYENDGEGGFDRQSLGAVTKTATADQTTILGWPTEGGTKLLVGNANYEEGVNAPAALNYSLRDGSVVNRDVLPGIRSTTGPMAAADYNGDGRLDLFVGGRFIPVRYPSNPTSRLFENTGGTFTLDRKNSSALKNVGMVTGAVFTDYDQDGDQDLLISRSWDSLMLFRNEDGNFENVTSEVGLDKFKGWWNGISTGDFNNDGLPDIVATNIGLNNTYSSVGRKGAKMFYHDFSNDGIFEIIEAYYDSTEGGYVPRRKLGAFREASVPFTSGINSHDKFATMTVANLVGERFADRMGQKKINYLRSSVFINEGGSFSRHPLPSKAQFSYASHVGVADFNNDGNEDLFLSQNFFQVPPKMPRHDAGRGLWLRGTGNGEFEPVPGHVSGVRVYGEQRGAALADFNRDGRTDLLVSQNGASTRLYENRTSKAGLIIRLAGPPSNRAGVGSSIRVVYPDGSKGPRREVQAGAGYWSQGGATQVMGYSRYPDQIEVTWFDGQVQKVKVDDSKKQYTVEYK